MTIPPAKTVLIVDDNRDNADTLAYLVRILGHATIVAYDIEDGLRVAREQLPDIIIHDIAMPIRTGYTIARELRAEHRFDTTLLIAHTGFATPSDAERARVNGFDIHLPKPTNMTALECALNSARNLPRSRDVASRERTRLRPQP